MGGLCALTFAGILKSENIPVSLVVTIDPAHASPKVPLNVERLHQHFPVRQRIGRRRCGGGAGLPGSLRELRHEAARGSHPHQHRQDGFRPRAIGDGNCATCDDAFAGQGRGACRCATSFLPMPRWSCGTAARRNSPVRAIPCRGLRHLTSVPLWSLTQANQYSDSAPLSVGQRVLVPRRLVPPVATSAASRPKR